MTGDNWPRHPDGSRVTKFTITLTIDEVASYAGAMAERARRLTDQGRDDGGYAHRLAAKMWRLMGDEHLAQAHEVCADTQGAMAAFHRSGAV